MGELLIRLENRLLLQGVPEALREWLTQTLEFPNPRYLENERLGRWNRGVPRRLRFHRRAGADGMIVPRGFLRQILLACRRLGIPCRLEDRRRSLPPVDFRFRAELRPFQRVAVARMLERDFGTLSAPAGSGKTVMALAMVAARRQPTLVVVHTRELAEQWTERIASFLGIPPGACGRIAGGRVRLGEAITVALVQSLYPRAAEVAREIGFLIVDECHRCPSRTFTEAVTAFDSRYMLGLSATPFRRDGLSRLIFWHLGDRHHEIEERDLRASGARLPVEVVLRETAFHSFHDPVSEYSRMLSELTADPERNRLIAADVAAEALAHGGVCLILSDRRAHCEALRTLLHYRHRLASELLTGEMSPEEREGVVARVNAGGVRVVIATGQLIGEGFDCPALSTLFLATPVRFSGRLIQYLGRVLRPAPGKEKARVFDYVDARVETLLKAALARQRLYRRLWPTNP
ncbi:MAG: DEAD/DEAH box helicase [Desulfobacterales bacterium]